jgi:hypothetical protein
VAAYFGDTVADPLTCRRSGIERRGHESRQASMITFRALVLAAFAKVS